MRAFTSKVCEISSQKAYRESLSVITNYQIRNKDTVDIQQPIDIVVLWVNGDDPEWIRLRNQYLTDIELREYATGNCRFRDWGTLRYWFRGIERFAPWARSVYFVTWGHIPTWLNLKHPKLRVVRHEEFMPAEYLPTFNSNAIELNLHRIEGLSETFVLFNDDTFLIRETHPEDFFMNGLPRDEMVEMRIIPTGKRIIDYTVFNNISIINRHFDKRKVVLRKPTNMFNAVYGKHLVRTLSCMLSPVFLGFRNDHLPASHLKSVFRRVWESESAVLDRTSRNRFRTTSDINHWLMRYWNTCESSFIPRSPHFGSTFSMPNDIDRACRYITHQSGKCVCVNDSITDMDVGSLSPLILKAFEAILPGTGEFELDYAQEVASSRGAMFHGGSVLRIGVSE